MQVERHVAALRLQTIDRENFTYNMNCLGEKLAWRIVESCEDVVLVPILRAGIGMLHGAQSRFPQSDVGFLGLKRLEGPGGRVDHVVYFESLPSLTGKTAIVLDPMLATGGSAIIAANRLKEAGAKSIVILCAIAAPEGLNALTVAHPDVKVVPAAVDEGLDEDFYIVPGLGDAGDRLYGVSI